MKQNETAIGAAVEEAAAPVSSLSAFFAQNAKRIDTVKIVVSDRFLDPLTSEPMKWEICCITAAENVAIRRTCMRSVPVQGRKGQYTQDFDANAYLAKVAARCTIFPNLNDAALQGSYGVNGGETLVQTMLTPGEFEDYSTKVLQINGFQSDDELVEEAKN